MGMHFGIIASRTSLDSIIEALRECGAELRFVKTLARLEDAPDDPSADYIIAGERAGASYLMDTTMVLSAGQADVLAAAAKRTGEVVVGCGAETVSGTFWFSAFSGPKMLRMYFMCRSALAVPFSDGKPFESEATDPLDMDWDGDGIFAALGELGFDYSAWSGAGPYQLFTLDNIPGPADQPLEDAQRRHWSRNRIASDKRPKVSVIERPAVSVMSSRSPSEPLAPGRRSPWQRFRSYLGRRHSWRRPKAGVSTLFSGDK